jgi:hypothetical protein
MKQTNQTPLHKKLRLKEADHDLRTVYATKTQDTETAMKVKKNQWIEYEKREENNKSIEVKICSSP